MLKIIIVHTAKIILCLTILLLLDQPNIYSVNSSRCHINTLPPGSTVIGLCRFRPPELCNVACVQDGFTLWKGRTRCLESGQWSPLPVCKHSLYPRSKVSDTPLYARSLIPIDCSKLPVSVRKKAFCVKLKLPTGFKCPELLHIEIFMKNCTREPRSHCIISCGDTFNNLTCLSNGRWSHEPSCISSRQNHCPEPEIGTLVNCSRREGEICKIQCPGGKIMKGDVACLSSGVWSLAAPGYSTKNASPLSSKNTPKFSIVSKCTCPSPNLTKEYEVVNDCEDKKIGEKCHLACKKQYSVIGKKTIICLPNATWSEFPVCSNRTCPLPEIDEMLIFKEDCSSKLPGEACQLECDGKAQLISRKHFSCINGTHWSKLPSCACHSPDLTERLMTDENCERKKIGRTCRLKCKEKYSISGSNHITCQSDGSWSSFPECQRKTCLKPKLPKNLITTEDCSSKMVGGVCQVECLNSDETFEIACLNGTVWSTFPKCSCSTPSFSRNLEIKDDCSNKKPGDKCEVSCRDITNHKTRLYVICQNNSKWGDEPLCEKNVCPRPVLPIYLLFDEDCTDKESGEKCHLICKMGGKIVGEENSIKCKKGKKWSHFPICSCPDPYIRENLEIVGNCSNVKPGKSCKLKCKSGLSVSGNDSISCKDDTKWTSQPNCVKLYCSQPEVTPLFTIQGDCMERSVGSSCEISCKEGGKVIGSNIITCLDTLKWSLLPNCTCPIPKLNDNIISKSSCNDKNIEEECELTCKDGFQLVGNSVIRCLPNTTWSHIPSCKSRSCSKPELSSILVFSETCYDKKPGDKCDVLCKEGGKIIGENNIRCLNETYWSNSPICACPLPNLRSDLKAVSDCGSVLPGGKCNLSCKEERQLNGLNFITCEVDTKWSSQPMCQKLSCPNPILSSILDFNEKCSSKEPSDTCELVCREGGNILGSKSIKCLDNLKWSNLPTCTCPNPDLRSDLKTLGPCHNISIGQKCFLTCKETFYNISLQFIECLNTTKWNSQPTCNKIICQKLVLPSFLMFEDSCLLKSPKEFCLVTCREGGIIVGDNKVFCLNNTNWGNTPVCACPTPLLDEELENEESCEHKTPGEKCSLRCRSGKKMIGNSIITCQRNFRWSSLPRCEIPYCVNPVLPRDILEFEQSCSLKYIEESCTVRCVGGGNVIGSNAIKCINETYWTDPPECMCPVPDLSQDLDIDDEDCNNKKKFQTCKVKCKGFKKLIGNNSVTCTENAKWSLEPQCQIIFCPRPVLPRNLLAFDEDCNFKSPYEQCRLRCEQGGNIIGSNNISCLNGSQWSNLPNCTCPPPSLNKELIEKENCNNKKIGETCELRCKNQTVFRELNSFITCEHSTTWSLLPKCMTTFCPIIILPKDILTTVDDCNSKIPGEKCHLRCKQGGNFIGNNFVECLSGGVWSDLPDCTCPEPNTNEDIRLEENCSSKKRGEECKISCRGNKKPQGSNFATCLNNTIWSPLPSCEEQFCPSLIIPSVLKFKMDCSTKTATQVCQLYCTEGGNITRDGHITCLNNLTWSPLPACSCPAPDLKDGLITMNCYNKFTGENCSLFCKDDFAVLKTNFITCMDDTKWSDYPECERSQCPKFNFQDTSIYIGRCENTFAGEKCLIACRQGGKFVQEQNYITCRINGRWSKPMSCFCPKPNLTSEYVMKDDCSEKLPGYSCTIACLGGFELKGRNYIRCDNLTTWGSLPPCESVYCPPPVLSGALKTAFDSCNQKKIGDRCIFTCINGGVLSGTGEIVCNSERSWGRLPTCICPEPTFPDNIEAYYKCIGKGMGDKCYLFCKAEGTITNSHFITCVMNTSSIWTALPNCPCSLPSHLTTYVTLHRECLKLGPFPLGTLCNLFCNNDGKMHNGTQITCLPGGIWSPSPTCTCSKPFVSDQSNIIYENCTYVLPGHSCRINCEVGIISNELYFCDFQYVWEDSPTCIIQFCSNPEPVLKGGLFGYNCSGLIGGNICRLGCRNGARLEGSEYIECVQGYKFNLVRINIEPSCVCTVPKLTQQQEFKENCDSKIRGQTCLLGCKNKFVFNSTCVMNEIQMWTRMPECRVTCPNIRGTLGVSALTCPEKQIFHEGDVCILKCVNSSLYISQKELHCLSTGKWSALPVCFCPLPQENEHFGLAEDCSTKSEGDKCIIRCKVTGYRIKPDRNFLQCVGNTWIGAPECYRIAECSSPVPELRIRGAGLSQECSNKQTFFQDEVCKIRCINGGLYVTNTSIQCLDRGVWSRLPSCSCPPLILNEHLRQTENCTAKFNNDKCILTCRPGFRFKDTRNFVQCAGMKWGALPVCEPSSSCSRPVLTYPLTWTENCESKLQGETCKLKCSIGNLVLENPFITCMPGLVWSILPKCVCPNLSSGQNWQAMERCNQKLPGQACLLWCVQARKSVNVTCMGDGQWTRPLC